MVENSERELSRANTRIRFEQWANNPECEANTVSAVLNVKMGKVAEELGYPNTKAPSPFAIVRGLAFEDYLFENDAAKLRQPLEYLKALQAGSSGFLDFRTTNNGGPKYSNLDEAIEASADFLKNLANGCLMEVPSITTGITLRLAKGVMLPEATLILDVMTVSASIGSQKVLLRVGEIKIYPDRGGYTDGEHLASARAQAGVYKHALEEWVEMQGLSEFFDIDDTGFLVFTWPGSIFPVVRPAEDLRAQAKRAQRGFSQLDVVAQRAVGADLNNYNPDDYNSWVQHSKTNYRETCWAFCDLAPRCQDQALADKRGVLLGQATGKLLATSTISRAIELLNGAMPESGFEESLKKQLSEANWGEVN